MKTELNELNTKLDINDEKYTEEQISSGKEFFYKYFISLTALYDLIKSDNSNISDYFPIFPSNVLASFYTIGSNQKCFFYDNYGLAMNPIRLPRDGICTPYQCLIGLMMCCYNQKLAGNLLYSKNFNDIVEFYNNKYPQYHLKEALKDLEKDISSILPTSYHSCTSEDEDELFSFISKRIIAHGNPCIDACKMFCYTRFKKIFLNRFPENNSITSIFSSEFHQVRKLKKLMPTIKTLNDLMPYIQHKPVIKVLNDLGFYRTTQLKNNDHELIFDNLSSFLDILPKVLITMIIQYIPDDPENGIHFFR